MSAHTVSNTVGVNYLDMFPNGGYIKRYFHVSKHRNTIRGDLIKIASMIVPAMLAVGEFIYDSKRYMYKL